MNKTALIVGSAGQDGRLLTKYLLEMGYSVIGIERDSLLEFPGEIYPFEGIQDFNAVCSVIKKYDPGEVYYLAAIHHSSEGGISQSVFANASYGINVSAFQNFLEAIKLYAPKTKIFYAASSHIYSGLREGFIDESSIYSPATIYGVHKLNGLLLAKLYARDYGVQSYTGILFNHESEYRSDKFLSMKLINAAIDISLGKKKFIEVGSISTKVDWGYAGDYVKAIYKIVNKAVYGEYIIATGSSHSVAQFAEHAFACLDLDWTKHVVESKELSISNTTSALVGSPGKLVKATGWVPEVSFKEMIIKMVIYRKSRQEE